MKILIQRIPVEGSHYEGYEPAEILELEEGEFFNYSGDIRYELYAQHVSEELIVRGRLALELEMRCARCSQFFSTTIEDSDFLRAYPAFRTADEVDITEEIREALLLQLPAFGICSGGECKGLCAQCGKVLNEGPCSCETEEDSGAWSALDNLNL